MYMRPTYLAAGVLGVALIGAGLYTHYDRQEIATISEHTEQPGSRADITTTVSKMILGKWESRDDPLFVREYKSDGTVVDSYDGSVRSNDTWVVFTSEKPLSVQFPLDPGAVYVQQVTPGDASSTLNFRVGQVMPETLDMTYMERGNTLSFRRVQ